MVWIPLVTFYLPTIHTYVVSVYFNLPPVIIPFFLLNGRTFLFRQENTFSPRVAISER